MRFRVPYRLLAMAAVILLFAPCLASAHSEHDAEGFLSGFRHPLLGMDHLLAMLGVGIVSARLGGRYIWIVPGIFVSFMIVGGIIGAMGTGVPMEEVGIAFSVVGIGIAIAVIKRPTPWLVALVMAFVAFFGALHGHAHGVEMPGSASPVYYSFGFATCTCAIHLAGVYLGQVPEYLSRLHKLPVYLGRAITLAGCYILYTHIST
jgi:urease accessory protein